MLTVLIKLDRIDYTEKAREWCKLPYPDHPKGCPAYGRRKDCPPNAPRFHERFDPPFYLVAVRFDLAEHAKKMRVKHPDWSEKQARCLLYWQRQVDKQLKKECLKLLDKLPASFDYTMKPEAMGVNVITTALKIYIPIETKPQNYVWKIAIIGKRKNPQNL